MKYIRTLLLLLSVLFMSAGCLTTQKSLRPNSSIETQGAYLAGNFSDVDYQIMLENLDTGEQIAFKFKSKNYIQISPIPAGRYAIIDIMGFHSSLFGSTNYYISTPLSMMRIINVNPNEIIYLGDYARERDMDSGVLIRTAGFSITGDMDVAFHALQEQYSFSESMDLVTIY